PGVDGLLPLGVGLRPALALDLAAHALHGAGGDDALRGAADAHEHVHGAVVAGRGDGPGHVAVHDQTHLGAGGADLGDELGVPGAVEHARAHVADVDVLGLGHGPDVPLGGPAQVDPADSLGADRDLAHVEHGGRVEHRPAFGDRDHGDRVGSSLGHVTRAV